MAYKNTTSLSGALTLGIINGLLSGAFSSVAHQIHTNYLDRRILEAGGLDHGVSNISDWYIAPAILIGCAIALFTLASFIVHKYLAVRFKSVILLWVSIGIVAVIVGALSLITIDWLNHVSMGIAFDYKKYVSAMMIRRLSIILVGVIALNYLYGYVIYTSLGQYSNTTQKPLSSLFK